MAEKRLVGTVKHFYPNISVAIVDVCAPLHVGDTAVIEGKETNFEQKVESMQIEHINVESAKAGDSVGLKVSQKVREGDRVYKAY